MEIQKKLCYFILFGRKNVGKSAVGTLKIPNYLIGTTYTTIFNNLLKP